MHDVDHSRKLGTRRKQQLASGLADDIFQTGRGDCELTEDIVRRLVNRDEIQALLDNDQKTNITTKEEARSALSPALFGALVAGLNTRQ